MLLALQSLPVRPEVIVVPTYQLSLAPSVHDRCQSQRIVGTPSSWLKTVVPSTGTNPRAKPHTKVEPEDHLRCPIAGTCPDQPIPEERW